MSEITKPIVAKFLANESTKPMTATRAILVFGKNSATYKFALMKTLCELGPKSELSYDEIGPTFLRHLASITKTVHTSSTGGTVLSAAMDEHLSGLLEWSKLYDVAEQNIFNNVFDATHNVGGGSISSSARLFSTLKADRKIVLTDNLNSILASDSERKSLAIEAERRWEVVEEGWRSGMPQSPIANSSDDHVGLILGRRRPSPRYSVPILHSLQKGRCFYCNKHMDLENQDRDDPNFPDEAFHTTKLQGTYLKYFSH